MHHINTIPAVIKDIFRLFSNFLTKMVESGILKTFTFRYSENYSYVEKNLGSIIAAVEELKDILLKIFSEIASSSKNIIERDTFNLLSSASLNNSIPTNESTNFSRHDSEYPLYTGNAIHDTIERNIQLMASNHSSICNDLEQNIDEFTSQQISKPVEQNIDFSECGSINSLLKETDENALNHTIQFSSYKESLDSQNGNVNSLLNVHESIKSCETESFAKNDPVKINHNLKTNVDVLNTMKYSSCNDGLYNTLKEAISVDFLQNMKFPSANTANRQLPEETFDAHVQYAQCETSLQNIDLDILNNTNERINNALERIFDDQFAENESLLESECWNVDINIPSAEPIQTNIDLQTAPFELPPCSENLKDKMITSNLNNSLVANMNDSVSTSLDDSISSNLNNSLSSALNDINQKYSNEYETDKFFCEHCGTICETKRKLKIHLKREHNVYVNNISRCELCGKIFKYRTALITHMLIHNEIKPFKCPYCWKTFTQKVTRDSHIQLHTGMYKYHCEVCQKRFPTQAKLNFHSKSHEEPELRCDICSKMFTTKQYLTVHKKSHNKPIPPPEKCFSCIECSVLFEKKCDLLLHIKQSHPNITFVCYYVGCARSFSTYKKMKDHIYKIHVCGTNKTKNVTNFECEKCKKQFVKKISFHRHNLLIHSEKINIRNSYNCMHCEKRFTTETGLDDHLEKFHTSTNSKDMDYSCSMCGSLFYEENALKEHNNIHSDFGTNLCQICGSVFSEKAEFQMHRNSHDLKKKTLSKKNRCEMCEKRFDNKMELKQHELDVHNILPNLDELKPYCCTYCDKRFTTRGKCNLHMETHSKNPSYTCNKCHKHFYRRDLLKEHMNTHTGYRSHVCKICGLGYCQKSSLKIHEATHTHKETLTCDQCGKLFRSRQALQFHVKTHDGNFRFACEICGKKFVRKCHYDLHIMCHSNNRPFKCLKCPLTYKINKHLREHTKKAHQNEPNFSSLLDSIYAEDDTATQHNLLDEYIPSIDPF